MQQGIDVDDGRDEENRDNEDVQGNRDYEYEETTSRQP
jgi:hypothetical protein